MICDTDKHHAKLAFRFDATELKDGYQTNKKTLSQIEITDELIVTYINDVNRIKKKKQTYFPIKIADLGNEIRFIFGYFFL